MKKDQQLPIRILMSTKNLFGTIMTKEIIITTKSELILFKTMEHLIEQKVTLTEQQQTERLHLVEYIITKQ